MNNDKLYSIKLCTKLGEVILEDIVEYVFAKRYIYYSNSKDQVGRIPRETVSHAYRLISDSSKWVEIKMKIFK